jgi:hypothetical protein
MTKRKTVRFAEGEEFYTIYPVEGVHIPGRAAVEQVVTEAEWLVINEYQPPAFVCDPLPPDEATAEEEE